VIYSLFVRLKNLAPKRISENGLGAELRMTLNPYNQQHLATNYTPCTQAEWATPIRGCPRTAQVQL